MVMIIMHSIWYILSLPGLNTITKNRDFEMNCLSKAKSEESPPNFICVPLSERRGKISIKPSKKIHTWEALARDKESVSQPRFGFGSQLRKGKVLTPFTSMVHHGNHLGCLRMQGFILLWFYFSKECV